jgi:hypothetical protein
LRLYRVTGWFYSFEINNWHGLSKKVETQQWKEREKDFSDYCPAEKRIHFFGNEVLRKMYGKEQCRKRKQRGVNCANLMLIICIKGSYYERPLYDHVLGNKRNSDKNEV